MDEKEFNRQHTGLLEALKKSREGCPDVDLLVSYQQGQLSPQQKTAIENHVTLCGLCQELLKRCVEEEPHLDDWTWKKIERGLEKQPVPWRPTAIRWINSIHWHSLSAIAALLLITLVGLIWLSRERSVEAPGPVSTTRGDAIDIVAPAGVVNQTNHFQWSQLPLNVTYRLRIEQNGKLVWQDETVQTRYPAPQELIRRLRPGVRYRWKVTGIDSTARTIVESAWTEFQLGV